VEEKLNTAQEHNDAWEKSGLTIVEYSRQKGINPHMIYTYRKKIQRKQASGDFFICVQPGKTTKNTESGIYIQYENCQIGIKENFSEECLCKVMNLLEKRRVSIRR
jgi:hypothetical protein